MRGKKAKMLRYWAKAGKDKKEVVTYKYKKAKVWLAGPLVVWVSYPQRLVKECWRERYLYFKKVAKR